MSARNPFAGYLGNVAARRTGAVQADGKPGWVAVYRAEDQGLSADDGPWVVICESHHTLVHVSSRRGAMSVLASGADEFCDCCRGACSGSPECPCVNCGRTHSPKEG